MREQSSAKNSGGKQSILNREMDRKEFLKYVGASLVALTGVTGMIQSLKGKKQGSVGYGSSAYGGKKGSS